MAIKKVGVTERNGCGEERESWDCSLFEEGADLRFERVKVTMPIPLKS